MLRGFDFASAITKLAYSACRLTLPNPFFRLKDSVILQVSNYGRQHSCEAPRRERERSSQGHDCARHRQVHQPAAGGCGAGGQEPTAISIDLTRPLEKDTDLRILTERDPEALEVYRHSSAHLLAAAVLELFPETKLGHGPATESGFFYDFYRPTPFTPEDLEKIEKKMQELVQQNIPYAREFLPRDQGLAEFKKEGDFMKCHFIEQFTKPDEKISIYRTGKFTDFCRGPHIPSTGKDQGVQAAEHRRRVLAGRREESATAAHLRDFVFLEERPRRLHLQAVEEAKKRDHRVLGKQLDLFSIQELAGPGLIFWHPKGGIIRKEMEDWMRERVHQARLFAGVHAARGAAAVVADLGARGLLRAEHVRRDGTRRRRIPPEAHELPGPHSDLSRIR